MTSSITLKCEVSSPKIMIEFYSGSGTMAKAFKKLGWRVITVDLNYSADWMTDILTITKEQIIEKCRGIPNFIWFGTPCTGFSVASIGTHWGGGFRQYQPKTDVAKLGIKLCEKNKEIISWFPNAKWGIENPRGVLRKLPVYAKEKRDTICFCQYETKLPPEKRRMKPTDIWSNLNWIPRPMCKNGAPCHVRAPRGSKTGTQGLKGAYERAVYPDEFCIEIATFANSPIPPNVKALGILEGNL